MEHARRVILFAAQDAGPAAYLAEIASGLGQRAVCLASKTAAQAFDRRGVKHESLDGARADVAKASGVVTGTSMGPSAEKELLSRAKAAGTPSVSVVEHWTNYRERFESGDALVLPDFILVNDEAARAGAESAGLPAAKLRVLGNPILEKLANAKPAQPSRDKWLSSLGIPKADRVVVFVSEVCGGQDLGFDEKQVLADADASLSPSDTLVIKLHPAENPDKYGQEYHAVSGALDVPSLALHADKIVGMGSMLLLETAVLRGDVVSHRPGARKPFIGDQTGATVSTSTRTQLKSALQSPRSKPSAWAAGFAGSTARIEAFFAEALA